MQQPKICAIGIYRRETHNQAISRFRRQFRQVFLIGVDVQAIQCRNSKRNREHCQRHGG